MAHSERFRPRVHKRPTGQLQRSDLGARLPQQQRRGRDPLSSASERSESIMPTQTPSGNRSSDRADNGRPELKLFKPGEIAKILGCSEWWIKEQARKRTIPFTW